MSDQHFKKQIWTDNFFQAITLIMACSILFIFITLLFFLIRDSLPSIKAFGLAFLWQTDWDPVRNIYGAAVAIYGTLVTSCIAILIGVPVSFGIAFFLAEMAPKWLKVPLRISVEMLAAIPSIIYGMWGLFIFAPFFANTFQPWLISHMGNLPWLGILFQGAPFGIGILTAGIILGIMIIPFISSVINDAFILVPPQLKESAFALGATHSEILWHVMLPYTRVTVMGGIMLGLGRALGETMAVAFVIGNAHRFSASLLMPGSSITSVLANEFTEASGQLYFSSLVELGLILFLIAFSVLAISKWMIKKA